MDNKIIDSKKVERDYNSSEYMRLLNSIEYKYGIVEIIIHMQKSWGSCIYTYKKKDNSGTSGLHSNWMKRRYLDNPKKGKRR